MQTALIGAELLYFRLASLVVPGHQCSFRRKDQGCDIVAVLESTLVQLAFDHDLEGMTQVKSGFDPTQPTLVVVNIPTRHIGCQSVSPLSRKGSF